ncbi:hypothetical protein CORC01_00506 [Colletotrichum orchidophilum]|uniref:Uncharacterized protein n=1 Tax=Colletotrichum orchidophilum TaxID=1209926 RepID=A0A1G4BSD1_9PEZI|nr:uncharacterized protein CORC01_00506 [Colletotrichum orchidophilum]OHF04167.1 hypothetical protein CORC01_00506 [Colletotrichum orchidophilum]
MKFFLSLVVLAAAASAANPSLLAKRAVYPQEGQVCCRHDGAKNCVRLPLLDPAIGVFRKFEVMWLTCLSEDLRGSQQRGLSTISDPQNIQ